MERDARIYVPGHTGLVGTALVAQLRAAGYTRLLLRTRAELDLTDAAAVTRLFADERPEYVFLVAGKVGGILANRTYPFDFIDENLAIETNIMRAAVRQGVRRLLFFGSACIYPREPAQPIDEDALLTGWLEPTNQAYAIAKIAGILMCQACNQQHGTQFLGVMPTNLYGPHDNFHPQHSHVIPGLIRRLHEAQRAGAPFVTLYGSGSPAREFLHVEDLARACLFLMQLPEVDYARLLTEKRHPIINVGSGEEISVRGLVERLQQIIGYRGEIRWDTTQPDGVRRRILDSSRLFALGWRPQVFLDEGLPQAYEWFRHAVMGG